MIAKLMPSTIKKRYVVYLPQKFINLIEYESKKEGASRSKIVRKMIKSYIDKR
jgi:metal-responsive CopG/Arc/MetJ family transcriptional regulator